MRITLVALAFAMLPLSGVAAQSVADSLYGVGRQQLSRGEFAEASSTLAQLMRRFPTSSRAQDAAYWEAFARYRRAADGDLVRARELLTPPSPGAGHPDAATLALRIGALLGTAPGAVPVCTATNGAVFATTLQSVGRESAAAAARTALPDQQCPVVGRRSAVILLGQLGGVPNWAALRGAARRDPDGQVRAEALTWLRRDPSREALDVVVDRAAHDPDRRAWTAAASILSSLAHPATRSAIHAFVRDSSIDDRRRQAVVSWSQRGTAHPDIDTLRAIFPGVARQGSLGSTIIEVIDARGDDADREWIWAQVRNPAVPTLARLSGLQRVGSERTVAELATLYGGTGVRLMKFGVLEQLRGHPDAAAVRALEAIIRDETSPTVRAAAQAALDGRG